MIPNYRFYLRKNGGGRIATAPGYNNLSKKYAKENGQEFFRTSMEGQITYYEDDYKLIASSTIEDKFELEIDKQNSSTGEWYLYYKASFCKTDCKFDYTKRTCKPSLTAKDEYTDVLAGLSNNYNLIKLNPAITPITYQKRPLMQIYVAGASSVSNYISGTYWEEEVSEPVKDAAQLQNNYHFLYCGLGLELKVSDAIAESLNQLYGGIDGVYRSQDEMFRMAIEQEGSFIDGRPANYLRIYYGSNAKYSYTSKFAIDLDTIKEGDTIYMYAYNHESEEYTNRFTANVIKDYRIYRRILCDLEQVTDTEGTKQTYPLTPGDFAAANSNYKRCIGQTKGYGIFYCTLASSDTPTKYGLNEQGKYYTSQFLPLVSYRRVLPLCKSDWRNCSLWYAYEYNYNEYEPRLRKPMKLRHGYSIAEVIQRLLDKVAPEIKHEATSEYSQFLYGAMPIGLSRFYVYLTAKSNILKTDYERPSQNAEISLQDIFDMLRDCLRCYWYIDGDKLRIEHVSYFANGGSYTLSPVTQIDLTDIRDSRNDKLISYAQSSIEYDTADIAKRYEFAWMDEVSPLFAGRTIDILSSFAQQGENKQVNISKFTSDVDYMIAHPSRISQDGFALLLARQVGEGYELPIIGAKQLDENGVEYTAVAQNWYASWEYLLNAYMYDMPSKNIQTEAQGVEVISTKKILRSEASFTAQEDLNTQMLINMPIGAGEIEELVINLNTRDCSVKLRFTAK